MQHTHQFQNFTNIKKEMRSFNQVHIKNKPKIYIFQKIKKIPGPLKQEPTDLSHLDAFPKVKTYIST